MRAQPRFLLLAAAIGFGGCWHSQPPADDDDLSTDGDSDTDADNDVDTDADGDACAGEPRPTAVDLLFMIDNSGSTAQEQANLTSSFDVLAQGLSESPARSLHVGVVSSDMGTGGFAVQTCSDAVSGDDGVLLHDPSQHVGGCDDTYPTFLSWNAGDDPAALSEDFSCIGTLGTGGCGFEQQLKAVRKAVTVHQDGANAGFLRDDSLLAIVIVTDEEDCSIREDVAWATDIFNTQLALGPLNLRCYNHGDEYEEPVETYVQDLLAVRRCPEDVAIFGIVGIPPETRNDCNLEHMTDADFECVLNLPEMQEVIDNSAEGKGERLTPSCDEAGLGEAFPPRRIVETIRQMGNQGAAAGVRSICQANLGPALQGIFDALQPRIGD